MHTYSVSSTRVLSYLRVCIERILEYQYYKQYRISSYTSSCSTCTVVVSRARMSAWLHRCKTNPTQPEMAAFAVFTARVKVTSSEQRRIVAYTASGQPDTIRVRFFHHAMASCSLHPHHYGGLQPNSCWHLGG
jgi:hypothetical protein